MLLTSFTRVEIVRNWKLAERTWIGGGGGGVGEGRRNEQYFLPPKEEIYHFVYAGKHISLRGNLTEE